MFGVKLTLNERMHRSYLIQRLIKPMRRMGSFAFGGGLKNGGLSDQTAELINGVFAFDYMGAAEFEYGAVPEAMQFIANQAGKKAVISGEHRGVYYICPKSYQTGVCDVINSLLADESALGLKEFCGLKEAISPKDEGYHRNTVGWLELNNGFFMFTDKEMFESTKLFFGVE